MFKTVEVKGLNKEEVLTVSERNRICLNAVVTEETRQELKELVDRGCVEAKEAKEFVDAGLLEKDVVETLRDKLNNKDRGLFNSAVGVFNSVGNVIGKIANRETKADKSMRDAKKEYLRNKLKDSLNK